MNPLARSLKRIAAQVARRHGFPFVKFLEEFGLEDVLIDAEREGYDLVELATQAIWRLCITDGKFNNFIIGFSTVMQFLNEQSSQSHRDPTQQFADLASILKQGGPEAAVRKWVETHYS